MNKCITNNIGLLERGLADSRLWDKAVVSPETAASWFLVEGRENAEETGSIERRLVDTNRDCWLDRRRH
jgi:hypothetical protein